MVFVKKVDKTVLKETKEVGGESYDAESDTLMGDTIIIVNCGRKKNQHNEKSVSCHRGGDPAQYQPQHKTHHFCVYGGMLAMASRYFRSLYLRQLST